MLFLNFDVHFHYIDEAFMCSAYIGAQSEQTDEQTNRRTDEQTNNRTAVYQCAARA